ncbi:branched-chain amino acid ABC transporter permease [Salinirubellus salinus]|jgi:branched-chain amino acid transport system permease protein|uniref:Branched-chain amino acid ABC transporter permease n=1 Tax=Salinirubellus salinus TaxID=1364945 RepID=A0A9E7UCQ0_9EURY|nr:branched-chain amino acid ABC transporter permease [Salinirubellus salinus]UWM56493.1 branched-chain amino acid ABC transporter permease [Salinirubellus salinus]
MSGETESTMTEEPSEDGSLFELVDPREMGTLQRLGVLALLGLAVFAPIGVILGRELMVLQLTGAFIFATYVMTWDVVSGYTGEISFGHALFFGVGAYTSAIVNTQLELSLFVTIPIGVVAATLAGLLIGFPSLRLHGPYFSLITLVTPIILISMLVFASDITGGASGLTGIDVLTRDTIISYYLAFGVFAFALVLFLAITRSDAGTVLTAIREDEMAVQAAGLNPQKFKLFAFVLSGAVGGLAGAIALHTRVLGGVASPSDLLALVLSIEVIVAAILGGMGTITGAAIGGLMFYMTVRFLRALPDFGVPLLETLTGAVADSYFLIFALLALVFLFYVPEGALPRIAQYVKGRQSRAAVAADGGRTPAESAIAKFVSQLRELVGLEGGDER